MEGSRNGGCFLAYLISWFWTCTYEDKEIWIKLDWVRRRLTQWTDTKKPQIGLESKSRFLISFVNARPCIYRGHNSHSLLLSLEPCVQEGKDIINGNVAFFFKSQVRGQSSQWPMREILSSSFLCRGWLSDQTYKYPLWPTHSVSLEGKE